MQQNENNILIYQDDNGITKVNVRFSDEDVWLTQAQLAEIYDTTQENISMHIKNIYKDAELRLYRYCPWIAHTKTVSQISSCNGTLFKIIV